MGLRRVSWDEFGKLAETVGNHIAGSRSFIDDAADIVLAIARGGIPLGMALADRLNISLAILQVRSYDGTKRTAKFEIGRLFLPIDVHSLKNYDVLVVDDLTDSGRTLTKVMDLVEKTYGALGTTSATLFYKPKTRYMPSYVAEEIPDDEWIVFPWEEFENRRAKD